VDSLPDRLKKDELVSKVRAGLVEIQTDVTSPVAPSADIVKAIQKTTSQLIDAISGPAAATPTPAK
jgi:hypothetical protein